VLDAGQDVEQKVRIHLGAQVAATQVPLAFEQVFVALKLGEAPFEQLFFGKIPGIGTQGS
jgi:hypothetical protein